MRHFIDDRLDCESFDSTIQGISQALDLSCNKLVSAFCEINLEHIKSEADHGLEGYEMLLRHLIGDPYREIVFRQVAWFHTTRVTTKVDFSDGIQPLGAVIDRLWTELRLLANSDCSDLQWQNFRRNLGVSRSANLYQLKASNSDQWGPYAVLVPESVINASKFGNVNFLQCPEIIEDICLCFQEQFSVNLLDRYRQSTRPCIVKFFDDAPRPDCFHAALYYAYYTARGESRNLYCSTNFDGKNQAIPFNKIVKIQFL